MKSQNDLFHGDENTTDKPRKYLVKCSKIIEYEVEVEAYSDTPSHLFELAERSIKANPSQYTIDQWLTYDDHVEQDDTPEPDYNYSLNYGGTD
jgi:hypothetical protein